VSGNVIDWQKWQIRVGFNYREGLVLHQIKYQDGGELRPIIHRASIAEMCVPYAADKEPFNHKCVFDIGDLGLGVCANPLELGCDCLGHIKYFDGTINSPQGDGVVLPNVICVHEEDHGILWKHTEMRTGHAESRRSRRLVISFFTTVANYEYGIYWNFYQDGSVQSEIKLTGQVSTNYALPGEDEPDLGTTMLPDVIATHHQHIFAARLDMAVDDPNGGRDLRISEVDVRALPAGPRNPYGLAFRPVETVLATEHEAMRDCNASVSRSWKISNPSKKHPYTGKPVAYKLLPNQSQTLLALPGSSMGIKAGFAAHNLWVTPHVDGERWPGGDYPVQNLYNNGLTHWVRKNRPLAGKDPVIWHCFGATHIARPEDWPVMPVEVAGFWLKPVGFFKSNPAIDLPATKNPASKLHCCDSAANGHANGQANRHSTTNGQNGHANVHSATNGHANGHAAVNGGAPNGIGHSAAAQAASDARFCI
ncbi:hypothetical protein WJX84_011698, partial [Apatococcus fuscideae]